MKKIFTIMLALLIMVIASVGCGSDEPATVSDNEKKLAGDLVCSETYLGTLSEESYENKESALTAFVENELKSDVSNAEFVGIEKEQPIDITNEETVSAFNLSEEQKDKLESITLITIKYKVSEVQSGPQPFAEGQNEKQEKKKVFLLVINGEAFYLDPLPEKGDSLTKSYFDSVLDVSKYSNCTLTQTQESKTVVSMGGMDGVVTLVKTLTLKYDGDKLYQVVSTKQTDSVTGKSTDTTSYAYIEEKEDSFDIYYSTDGFEFKGGNVKKSLEPLKNEITLEPIEKLSDLLLFCQYDYSYLQKTDTGFTLKKDYKDKYFEQAVGSIKETYISQFGANVTGSGMDVYYYVANGVLTKFVGNVHINMSFSTQGVNGNIKAYANTTALLSDFGTTVVTKPSNIVLN